MRVPPAQPRAMQNPPVPEVASSPALSLFARPGESSIRTRRIAILVADGVDGKSAAALHAGLSGRAGRAAFCGRPPGRRASRDGDAIEVDVTFETMPSVLFDALVVPGFREGSKVLAHSAERGPIHQGPVSPLQAHSGTGKWQEHDRKRRREIDAPFR